jgi:hypothetical protein
LKDDIASKDAKIAEFESNLRDAESQAEEHIGKKEIQEKQRVAMMAASAWMPNNLAPRAENNRAKRRFQATKGKTGSCSTVSMSYWMYRNVCVVVHSANCVLLFHQNLPLMDSDIWKLCKKLLKFVELEKSLRNVYLLANLARNDAGFCWIEAEIIARYHSYHSLSEDVSKEFYFSFEVSFDAFLQITFREWYQKLAQFHVNPQVFSLLKRMNVCVCVWFLFEVR